MFTGIIENTGIIRERKIGKGSGLLKIELDSPFDDFKKGESIAVNGVCLTLEKSSKNKILEFHVLEETLKKTNIGSLPVGSKVNIERALAFGDRLGGHLITGHVDASCSVRSWHKNKEDWVLSVSFPESLSPYIVEKGSIAVDGISLTLVEVEEAYFTVHLIPETCKSSSIRDSKIGDPVNIETDIIGKYVYKSLSIKGKERSKIKIEDLKDAGW